MTYPNTIGTGDAEILDTGIARIAVNAVVVTCVMSALALSLAITRFVIRWKAGWGMDDSVLVASVPFLIIQIVAQFFLAFWAGEGWLMADLMVYPERIVRTSQLIYWPSFSYGLVTALIKTSILLSYYRIFGHMRNIKIAIWILIFATWAWCMSNIFGMAFQCTPVEKAWHAELPGTCIDIIAFLWGNSISNMLIDWLILAIPIGPVLKLQLPTPKKILVGGAFLCGSLACIASTIRAARTADFDPMDLGRSVYDASVWIYLEPPMATISACLPFLSRIWGARALKGIKSLTNRVGTNKGSSKDASTGASHNGSTWVPLRSTNRETSPHSNEYADEEAMNIRKTTTTMVHGQDASRGVELRPYDISINGALRTTDTESQKSLV